MSEEGRIRWRVRGSVVSGETAVPGDKSISHRALMLGAVARGRSQVRNLAPGADVCSTTECLRGLGVEITRQDGTVEIVGGTLLPPASVLDAGNSGTTMRLLSGILAGQSFTSVITGDGSLRARPMTRIVEPLRRMGARVEAENGCAPLRIAGGNLKGITFQADVPSAQVKSCVLLAGLFADGETVLRESVSTRDHTERLMRLAGLAVSTGDHEVRLRSGHAPASFKLQVPGDISSAAFLFAGAALTGSAVTVRNLGINPGRTGFLAALKRMGCSITMDDQIEQGGEPVARVTVAGGPLVGIEIGPDEVPGVLDELPLVALLACVARGETRVTGASELRVKESDRIAVTVQELRKIGAEIVDRPDGFAANGQSKLSGATCDSHGDHRIAMMLAVAGLRARGDTIVRGVESAEVSFPGFAATLQSLGANIDQG